MNPAFNRFVEESCLALARAVPEFPTQMGLFEIAGQPVPQDYFTAIDEDSVQQRQRLLRGIGRDLGDFPAAELDESERLSAGVLDFLVHFVHERGLIGTAAGEFLQHEYLVRPSVGLQSELPLFLTDLHPMRHAGDAGDYFKRLKAIASHLDEAKRQIRDRQSRGLLPPLLVLEDSIEEIERFIATPPRENILLSTLMEKSAGMSGLSESSRATLLEDAAHEIENNTYPAYRKLLATLREQASGGAAEPGVWRLPDGNAWYDFQLRAATTTDLTADDIHRIGLEEMDRLERTILRACAEIGIAASNMTECRDALNARTNGPLADTEENRRAIVDRIEDLMSGIEPHLPGLFRNLPRGRVIVKAIPRFAEANRNQSYQPPSLDGSRDGFFELNVGQLLGESDSELPILVYHEIFPGHHLQITLAQETENLPSLRRIITFDAYIEGWAKYAETIPERHGINDDPEFHIARMRRELISTINLVLDTGIHAKRWSVDEATNFLDQHTGMGPAFSRYIVHRSASVPAQMCSYKIGMMKMQELRNRMETALGSRFDVRDFHHSVLSRGALPLSLLESVVDQDIENLRS
jgi:uncharacterized protein (DUF885 family)